MKHLNLIHAMTMAASVLGHGGSVVGGRGETPIREADSIRRPRRGGGSNEVSEMDSTESLDDGHGRIYVSGAEYLLDILRQTQQDRTSPNSPPLHFEIEVDLSSEDANDQDLSHFRRLSTQAPSPNPPDTGAKRPSPSTLLLQLATANSAISSETTFDFHSVKEPNQKKEAFVDKLTILMNDPNKSRGLTVLSVNTDTGSVSGIQRGNNGNVRKLDMFELDNGEVVQESSGAFHPGLIGRRKRIFMSPVVNEGKHQNFTCGVEHKEEWDERMLLEGWRGVRGREEEMHSHHHDHGHEHDHQHFNIRHLQNLFSAYKPQAFKPPTDEILYDENGPPVRFEINMIIDIDAEFIQRQGGAAQAIEYVNFLMTVANVILENEVGARLNVVHIQEVTYFKSVDNLRDGLKVMREQYVKDFPEEVQLRHALLGSYIGGGIAFIDAVCDDRYGVGLSSGLGGRIGSLDDDSIYDLFIMLHEIGHSLGSDHTFESTAYKPRVDTCGLESCPKELPASNSASIMSYCDFCAGGLTNVALSLGGKWNGNHPRLDIKNWGASKQFSDLSVSKNPERVSHQIWKTLYNKGRCIIKPTGKPTPSPVSMSPTSPYPTKHPISLSPTQHPVTSPPTMHPVTSAPTLQPVTSPPTLRPTTAEPTKSPTSSPTSPSPTFPSPSSSPTSSPTLAPTTQVTTASPTNNYGPFFLSPPKTCEDSCYLSRGIMFDIGLGANAIQDILVESIAFEHTEPRFTDASIDLYRTFVGGHRDQVDNATRWDKIDTIRVASTHGTEAAPGSYTASEYILDPPVSLFADTTFGFYIRASSSILRVGTGSNANSDDTGLFIGTGSTVMGGTFGIGIEGYLFNVKIGYSIVQPTETPTTSPHTVQPTPHPTSLRPTGSNATNTPTTISPPGSSLFATPTLSKSSNTTQSTPEPTTDTPTPSYWIKPSTYCNSNCLASSGFMFDVRVGLGSRKITINAIEFEHLRGSAKSVVDIYTTYYGSIEGKEQQSNQWVKTATLSLPQTVSNATAILDPPITLWSGATRGFYLAANEGILMVGLGSADSSDSNGVLMKGGSVVFGRFGKSYSGYHVNARVGYSINP